jgi:DNA modification methylase
MADDCTVFVCSPQGGDLMMMMMMMRDAGIPVRHNIIWDKMQPTFSMGRLDYDYQHEPILLTWGKRHKRPMLGTHKTSVWQIQKPRSSKEHPTMKPVELVVNALLNNSEAGDVVYDAYSGSGTTLLACEQTGRKARVIEIMPGYVAVALQRYKDATGNQPELLQ